MEDNNAKVIEVDGGILALKFLAETLNTDAVTVARVLVLLEDNDLDFVVDTLTDSESQEDVDRAVEIFNTTLETLDK